MHANLRNNEFAINYLGNALDKRPGYVRAWVNTGIAYGNLGDWKTAARFYLSALAMNPKAVHLWSYVVNALVMMGRMDLVKKVDLRDPFVFRDEFDVIGRQDLPHKEKGVRS